MKKNIGILVLCLVLCGRIFSQENKINVNNDADLIFLNGTGERITDIEIRSAESKGICSMSNIVFEDQKALGIDLPSRMEKHNKFQVIIKYGKRTAKTKNIEIVCKKNNIAPTYLLTIAGKDSSIPLAAGAIAGCAGIATVGAGALPVMFAWIGSLIGGGLGAGVAVVAAVPLAIVSGVFAVTSLLTADKLILTRVVQIEEFE